MQSIDEKLMQNSLGFQIVYNNLKLKLRNILFWTANRRHAQSKPPVYVRQLLRTPTQKPLAKIDQSGSEYIFFFFFNKQCVFNMFANACAITC